MKSVTVKCFVLCQTATISFMFNALADIHVELTIAVPCIVVVFVVSMVALLEIFTSIGS